VVVVTTLVAARRAVGRAGTRRHAATAVGRRGRPPGLTGSVAASDD